MVRLWQWFKDRGHANAKPVAGTATAGATVPVRKSDSRSKAAALEQVAESWSEDGDRADQDYYHVPSGGNPDVADPPALGGEKLPKPKKRPRVKSSRNTSSG
jgi:hypothetical protein